MKILNIVGARPQIIKASAISRAIRDYYKEEIEEIVAHTGQHYDEKMSDVFFDELQISKPDYNLETGSGKHGEQTAHMIKGLEKIILQEEPDGVIVYGDTNSTLAAAVAASKLHCPVIHIEAGLRSFNKKMPEEINRIMCDHVSTLLFAPTPTACCNLQREGFDCANEPPYNIDNPAIFHCGDVMLDNSLYFSQLADNKSNIIKENSLEKNNYILTTIHRADNTNCKKRLTNIFETLILLSQKENIDVVLPLHPRTANVLDLEINEDLKKKIDACERVKILPPTSFLDMISLEKNAKLIITDSGGVQKEAYFFNKPSIILRKETEWVEIVESGSAFIADAEPEKIVYYYNKIKETKNFKFPPFFGKGKAAFYICGKIIEFLK